MANYIKFNKSTNLADATNSLDPNTVYFTTDTEKIILDGVNYSGPTLYDEYKECGGTMSATAFPIAMKYHITPFMISNNSVTTIPNELLNESRTNFITDYYWNLVRITGGEPVITIQWDNNIPSRIKGLLNGKEFTVDFSAKTITPIEGTGGNTSANIDLSNYALKADLNNYLPKTGGQLSNYIWWGNDSFIILENEIHFMGGSSSIMGTSNKLSLSGPSINLTASNFTINDVPFSVINLQDVKDQIKIGTAVDKAVRINYATSADLELDVINSPHLIVGPTTSSALHLNRLGILAVDAQNAAAYLRINPQGGTVYIGGNVQAPAFFEVSDIRKKDIKSDLSLEKCYNLIDKCQTIIYSLKDQTEEQVGLIALEIEEFFPEVVATDKDGFKSLAYDRLVVICFKVLKDVIKRLEKLENHG